VKTTLENLGFVVSEVAEPDTSVDYGTVLRTSPEQGTQAVQGSTVIVYYASDENLVEVPKLIGWDVDAARRLLTSLNLVLDENIAQENSFRPKGEIIKQSYDEKLKVAKGTKISITVSTGIPPDSTASINITLPSGSPGETGTIKAYLNSTYITNSEKVVLLDGSDYSFDITGSGKNNKLKVFVDTTLVYQCDVNFTTTPGTISNEIKYSSSTEAIIPKVTGMTESQAITALENEGFNNISIHEEVVSNPTKIGKVTNQDPGYSLFTPRPLDTAITLTIGVTELSTAP
jgi:serine/threonine-protein kinase